MKTLNSIEYLEYKLKELFNKIKGESFLNFHPVNDRHKRFWIELINKPNDIIIRIRKEK